MEYEQVAEILEPLKTEIYTLHESMVDTLEHIVEERGNPVLKTVVRLVEMFRDDLENLMSVYESTVGAIKDKF